MDHKTASFDGNVGTSPKDLWQHRSRDMRCKSCMWFVQKHVSVAVDATTGELGRCRKHSPVVGQGWPSVFEQDWCGDHKLS